ncbi:hypothetical protein DKX38_021812 [Salix brachista]|uniref:Cytochrome b5 heme-binding domain-containing protein n=1 Tax=Salix brachista TaxID=2182728 RepID=A0A5N5K2R7_9ROSI|nr:hypothetical protein DKX38_021812 [Salix brachista]
MAGFVLFPWAQVLLLRAANGFVRLLHDELMVFLSWLPQVPCIDQLILFVKDMASSKVYLFDEIAKHNKTKDCWLIISGKVYDVTSFMDDHPGGDEVLLSSTGKDATNDFEDVGHSDDARETMEKYVIGEVDATTVPTKRLYVGPGLGGANPKDDKQGALIKILQLLVPLLILGLALAVRTYTKKE